MEKRLFVQLNGNRKVMGILRGYDVTTPLPSLPFLPSYTYTLPVPSLSLFAQ